MNISSSDIIEKYAEKSGIDLYLDEAEKANRRFNLYSRRLSRDDLRRFIAESYLPLELGWIGADSGKLIDVGSGWGIPAVPLLLAGIQPAVTMVERSQRKADFLLLLIRRLGVAADIVCGEATSASLSKPYDIITVRGVALDSNLVGELKRLAGSDSSIIYFGPTFPVDHFAAPQYVDYSIDNGDERRIWKADFF